MKPARSVVEIVSNGTRTGTAAWLVLTDERGEETRYRIPGVTAVSWRADALSVVRAVLVLEQVETRARIPLRTDVHSAGDIMAELAANKLREEKK